MAENNTPDHIRVLEALLLGMALNPSVYKKVQRVIDE